MVSITYTAKYGAWEKQAKPHRMAPSSEQAAKIARAAEAAAHQDAALAALFAEDQFVF